MQTDSNSDSQIKSIPIESGLCVLYGYGVKVNVHGNHLHCEDGICEDRRASNFHRATSGLKRLAVLSTDGYISLGAVQWLHDIGAGILVIGDGSEVLLADVPPGSNYPALRRAQAMAASSETGFQITRELIGVKIRKQVETLNRIGKSGDALSGFLSDLDTSPDYDRMRVTEAHAASLYWSQWVDVPLTFAKKDREVIPDHWLRFGERRSLLNNGARKATSPGNALLNYAYAILEGETRIAILTQGLDPGVGLMHSDQEATDSLVYDVMETARPDVDLWLYRFLQKRTFTKDDFWETERGEVRLSLELRHSLTRNARELSRPVYPWIEFVAKSLSSKPIGTFLTQGNRSAGRNAYRRAKHRRRTAEFRNRQFCASCGTEIDPDRKYCDECLPERIQEISSSFYSYAHSKLRNMRSSGNDKAHGGEAARLRAERLRKNTEANRTWADNGELDGVDFKRNILPGLQNISLTQIRKTTGLSLRYCSLIQKGKVPHKRHWQALISIIKESSK